ncbi:ABCC5 [Bugula neritina]|uniref:ABCC5 n=1 Tax=Bugula neritina TaxID=10212 RepID=A0A7J7KQJ5_BUGNE|nr:ABCC5 [Bugula neritina]
MSEGATTKMLSAEDYEPTKEDEAYKGWRHLIPFRPSSKNKKTLPLLASGPLNYLCFHWLNGIMWKAHTKGVSPTDLYDTPWRDSAACNSERFEKLWNEEVAKRGKEKASVVRTILRMIRTRLLVTLIGVFILSVTAVVGPLAILNTILKNLAKPEDERLKISYLVGLDIALAVEGLIKAVVFGFIFTTGSLTGVRVRGGVFSCVLKKILSRPTQSNTVGQLVTLCANDGNRLADAVTLGVFTFGLVVAVIAAAYAIYLLGLWGFLGFGIFFMFIPLQVPLIVGIRKQETSYLSPSLIIQNMSARFPQLVNTLASSLTFLAMTGTNSNLTAAEAFVFIALLNALRFVVGILPHSTKALAESLNVCQRVKAVLIAENEDFELAPFKDADNLVEIRDGYFGWQPQPKALKQAGNKDRNGKTGAGLTNGSVKAAKKTESLELIETEVEPLTEKSDKSSDMIVTLHNINMSLKEGTLLGVCGAVGSGKSSIIHAILRMMRKQSGEIAINQTKKIAYVPQQAWIMNATVRENILFGNDFDVDWYNKVVEACALLSDFDQLPGGDQTEIGERGINLSGGQKQRISIARAVYSNSDIILLDDPLSAVDAHVGQHIFTRCLKDVLRNKTVLFVTHQLQFLSGCDFVMVMKNGRIAEEGTHEGLMAENGEYSALIKTFHGMDGDDEEHTTSTSTRKQSKVSNGGVVTGQDYGNGGVVTGQDYGNGGVVTGQDYGVDFKGSVVTLNSVHSGKDDLSHVGSQLLGDRMVEEAANFGSVPELSKSYEFNEAEAKPAQIASIQAGKLTKNEMLERGAVTLSTYKRYIKAAGGPFIAGLLFFLILLNQLSQAFSNYWLTYWLKDGSGEYMVNGTLVGSPNVLLNPKLSMYQAVYGCSLVFILIVFVGETIFFAKMSLRSSTKLHDTIFAKIVASPMKFFDVTPSGQILNRFSKDLDEADVTLPTLNEPFLHNICQVLIIVGIVASVFPYLLIALVPITIGFLFVSAISRNGIRGFKRIENVTRSPLLSHITTTVQGLSTIKAYKKEKQFLQQFNKLQDNNNMATLLFSVAVRWSSTRLNVFAVLMVLGTSLFATFIPSETVNPTLAALAVTYSISMIGLLQYVLRSGIETEASFTSVERLTSYMDLESEAPSIVDGNRPDGSWPKEGAIQFSNVDMRYREGLPLVLKNITLDIKPQEKIGVVGRTGSGKSSLAMVLFRMMELDGGSITIDGIDISTIGLEDLRSKLSIIPQDPVLFVGTVRYNLDPFNTYTDEELWSALTKCHIKDAIQALDGQLDATIVENGENFSVGERQLLCMARALLRHSKILVLDEATAAPYPLPVIAIDTETDSLIQETIKEAFVDCTMLTIAHRLNTVINYDKILVLDNGEVLEFDSPSNLIADAESAFSHLLSIQESQKHSCADN